MVAGVSSKRGVHSFNGEKLKAKRLDPNRPGGPLKGEEFLAALKANTRNGERTVSRSAVTDYESCLNFPEPWALRQVAAALGVHPRELCDVAEGEETITNLREWAGLSKMDMQNSFGWQSGPYKNWEEGKAGPPSWSQHRILTHAAKMFGVTKAEVQHAWVMSGDKPRPKQVIKG